MQMIHKLRHHKITALYFLLLVGFLLTPVSVQNAQAEIPAGLRVVSVSPYGKDDPDADVGLGERLQVIVKGPAGTGKDTNKFQFNSLILYLDNRPLVDIHPEPIPIFAASCIARENQIINKFTSHLQEITDDTDKTKKAKANIENAEKRKKNCGDTITLLFELKRKQDNKDSRAVWSALLGAPNSDGLFNRIVPVGIGLKSGERILELESNKDAASINLEILGVVSISVASVIYVIAFVLFLFLCFKSNIIRQAPAPNFSDKPAPIPSNNENLQLPDESKPPYSLGKTQMAWWFFLVLGAYLFISVATLNYESISAQALVLIGIAAATGFGAIAIDSSKITTAKKGLLNAKTGLANLKGRETTLQSNVSALANVSDPSSEQSARNVAMAAEAAEIPAKKDRLENQIEAEQKILEGPDSDNFGMDLVSDSNGVSFHRFQNVAWSIVLGGVFVVQVWQNLAMPEFSTTLLTLMGITSGTYLGFKFPEKKVK